jgi:hypothetical protein
VPLFAYSVPGCITPIPATVSAANPHRLLPKLVHPAMPPENGYTVYYNYCTINGDPFTNNLLIFEDSRLLEPFMKAYKEYCHTKDAYYEEIGYWMRRS